MSKPTQCNRNKATWLETKNKTAWLEAKKETDWLEIKKVDTLTLHAYHQGHHKWSPPSEEEHGTHIIYGTSITWNDNICSWNMNNVTTLTWAYTTTLSDVTAAIATLSDVAATIANIAFTEQKTAGAGLAAAVAAAKAFQLPTTITTGIDDEGTVAIDITQDQTRRYLQSTISSFTQEGDLQSTPASTSSSSCNHADTIVNYIITDNNKLSLNLILKLNCDCDCGCGCDCDCDRYDKHNNYSASHNTILCGNDYNTLHFENVSLCLQIWKQHLS